MAYSNESTSWAIGPVHDGPLRPIRTGVAADNSAAWAAALAACRCSLLARELDAVAVSIDGQVLAIVGPPRDSSGHIDPAALTTTLAELHQAITYPNVANLVAGHDPPDSPR